MAAGTQNRRRILIAAVAGMVAVGAFVVVFTQISAARLGPVQAAAAVNTARAVVAAADINVGDQLSATNVVVTDYPSSALPAPGLYYVDVKDVTTQAWYSTAKLPRGQLILSTQLTQEVTPVKLPPVSLKEGNVAMSIPYDENRDSGGFIQQDDYIDILVDDPNAKTVHYAFQGVHVLHVGDRSAQPGSAPAGASPAASPSAAAGASLLLVEIPREQAAALAFAIDQSYTIRYVIRPHDQQTQQSLPNSAPVGQDNWLHVIAG